MFIYKFSKEEFDKCSNFANSIDTSYYSNRNQSDNKKRTRDQLIGKLGEIVSYTFLNKKINNLSYPDFKIYDRKNKSWDFDLKGDNANIHVKSQDIEQSKKYGESWLFQAGGLNNRGYDKEIFDKLSPNQYICFCIIDLKNNEGVIKSIVTLDYLHDNKLFKLPKLDKLKYNNKLAVYFSDIKETNMLKD